MPSTSTPYPSLSVDECQLVMSSLANAVWEADSAGKVRTDAPSWRAYTGQSVANWLRDGWLGTVHPNDRPVVEGDWKQAIRKGTPLSMQVRVTGRDGDWHWIHLHATPVADAAGVIQKWLGLAIDISETKKSEKASDRQRLRLEGKLTQQTAEVEAGQRLLNATLDSSLDMIQVFEAVRNEQGVIVDFIWVLLNHAAETFYGPVIGKRLLEENPGVVKEGIFETFCRVVQTGEPDQSERHYTHEQFNGWFLQSTVKLNDGVATTTANITDPKEAEEQLRRNEMFLQSVIDSSLDIIQVFNAVTNEQGTITDFVWVMNNSKAQVQNGDVLGKSLLTVNPGVRESGIFDRMVEVVQTGHPFEQELHYTHEQFDGWFYQALVKTDGGVAMTTRDITRTKLAEQAVFKSRELLHATINSSLDRIHVLEAIRDEKKEIIDFRWILMNETARQKYGDYEGKRLRETHPGVVPSGIFSLFCDVVESGQPQTYEMYYDHEGVDAWLHQRVVKLGDGIANATTDITERKRAEAEIHRLNHEIAQRASDRYYSIFNSISEGFCIIELLYNTEGSAIDYQFIEVNPVFEKQTGLREVVGKRGGQLTPGLEHYWVAYYDRVAQTGEPADVEDYHAATNRWYVANASRVGGAGSRQVAIVFRDITELKRREQAQAYLLALNDTFRSVADPMAIEQTVTEVAMAHFGADRCYYASIEGAYATIQCDASSADLPSVAGTYPLEQFAIFKKVVDNGGPIVVEDTAKTDVLDDPLLDICRQLQVVSFINIPVIKQNRAVGIFSLVQSTPRKWTEAEVELVIETAERTWLGVERAKAQRELVRSEAQLQAIFERAQVGMSEIDASGRFTRVNSNLCQLLGHSREELLALTVADVTYPDDVAASRKALHHLIRTGEAVTLDKRYVRSDGQQVWANSSVSRLPSAQGSPPTFLAITVDLTQRRLAQEALRKADARKDEFLAMLAHELRNPMATIRNGLQIQDLTTKPGEIAHETVAMMNRQTDHLVRMVDDLLDVSRISQGKIELKTERVDLVKLVQEAAKSMEPQFREGGKSLTISVPATPIELEGDATRLNQVITNLLTNGLRYTGPKGIVSVTVSQQKQPTGPPEAVIQVADNGIGLAAEQLSAVFELFVQVDHSLDRSHGGLGLGLTLVRQLVQQHGGRVEAQSAGLGQGSTFSVYLPTLPAQPSAPPLPTQTAPEPVVNRRILVVDDNTDSAFTLGLLLKLKGYETHTRNSGREGIEAAEQLKPAVILLDIGMPGLDGFETCQLIRQQPWGHNIVIIALTGYGQPEDIQRTQHAGFNAHLVKPVSLAHITGLLRQWVSV
ncbi:PAS domain S-box protein [Rudanella paleaurantiibacter]|uniref:histidine kinase n=1 Tax=Rudanella paleaurantiibacter TaxID=2614655 RepID=A0A7J5TTX1_9BACT|nr:PAS domain S-box protein [Rudanella paleaurantiibacter]KAB7727317.1 PAS domain S-box protein [Rudanella paleaurantiibacter]